MSLILGLSSSGILLLQSNVACGSGLLFFVLSSLSVMAGFGLSMLVALSKVGQLKRPLQQLRGRRVQLGRELQMLIADVPIVDEHVHLPQCLANESDNDDLEAGVKVTDVFQLIDRLFLGRLGDLQYIIENPSDVESQFTSLLIWMAITAGLHAIVTPLVAFFIFCCEFCTSLPTLISSGGALLLQSNVACGSGLLFFVLSSLSVMAGFGLSMLVALSKVGQLKRPLQQLRGRRVQLGRELQMLIADVPIVDEHVHLPQCLANESDNDDLEAGVKVTDVFQPIDRLFLGRFGDLLYIIENPSDVESQFTSLLIWMAIIAGLHAIVTPMAAFFIFCYRENVMIHTILWMANYLGSAITGPIGKEGADLWPRIASAANATV